jgi:hypothetical protein
MSASRAAQPTLCGSKPNRYGRYERWSYPSRQLLTHLTFSIITYALYPCLTLSWITYTSELDLEI